MLKTKNKVKKIRVSSKEKTSKMLLLFFLIWHQLNSIKRVLGICLTVIAFVGVRKLKIEIKLLFRLKEWRVRNRIENRYIYVYIFFFCFLAFDNRWVVIRKLMTENKMDSLRKKKLTQIKQHTKNYVSNERTNILQKLEL